MYYIYGDWMIANPTAVIATSGYSCANCHSTGFSGGTAATPGVQSIGTAGYAGTQPADAGASYVAGVKAGYKWDREGIQCGRCHNATVPTVTQAMINASIFPATAPTSGGMGALAGATGRNNLCFGCHQSMAKSWPSGATQYDPSLIPTGVSHGAAAGRDFNGHVIGNSFLNSPHARYTGTVIANPLGENDLFVPNGIAQYSSSFQGNACGGSEYTRTPYNLGTTTPIGVAGAYNLITTPTDCNNLYGAPSQWGVDGNGTQGTCTTCHDVHNSLYWPAQVAAAIKHTCADCHQNNTTTGATVATVPTITAINHPAGAATPFDNTMYSDACVVCHMAEQAVNNGNQTSSLEHLFRINTSLTYNTFPTTGQFYGGTCSVHTGAVQNGNTLPTVYLSDISSANCTAAGGTWTAVTQNRNATTSPDPDTYANAVWIDLDLACGQCHGGDLGYSAVVNSAPYISKANLAVYAGQIHTAGSAIDSGPSSTGLNPSGPRGNTNPNKKPTAANTVSVVGFAATLTDNSISNPSGDGCNVGINWGDGTMSTGTCTSGAGVAHTFGHVYSSIGTYAVLETVTDSVNNLSAMAVPNEVTVPFGNTSVTITVNDDTGAPIPFAQVYVYGANGEQYAGLTTQAGTLALKISTDSYKVNAVKGGYTFNNPWTLASGATTLTITAN